MTIPYGGEKQQRQQVGILFPGPGPIGQAAWNVFFWELSLNLERISSFQPVFTLTFSGH